MSAKISRKNWKLCCLIFICFSIFGLDVAKGLEFTSKNEIIQVSSKEAEYLNQIINSFGWDDTMQFVDWVGLPALDTITWEEMLEASRKAGYNDLPSEMPTPACMAVANLYFSVPGYVDKYRVDICFHRELLKYQKILGAYIIVYPMVNMVSIKTEKIILPINSSLKDIKSLMANYYSEYSVKPYNFLAALDFPGGKIMNTKKQENIRAFFKNYDWKPEQYMFLESSYFKVSKQEIDQIKKCSENIGMIGPDIIYNFLYAERAFKIKNTEDMYFIDFCLAVDLNNFDASIEKDAQIIDLQKIGLGAWLMVKPAKKNKEGKLDRFIYSINTPISKVTTDMKAYFKENK